MSLVLSGIISKSTAQSWSIKTSGVTEDLLGVWFVSPMQGWAVGEDGVILVTSDGGDSWTPQVSGVTVNLNDVFFVSPTTGWAVGGSQTILHTDNGGSTWTVQNSSTSIQVELYSVFFTSPTTGFAAGSNGAPGIIYTTTNGGATWQVSSAPIEKGIFRIFFTTSNNGWLTGRYGIVYATTDGGSTWVQKLPAGANIMQHRYGLFMYDNNKGWVCGASLVGVKRTDDGGDTWTNQPVTNTAGLLDITFTDSLTGWIVGSATTFGGYPIRYTTDGGATWMLDSSMYLPISALKGVHFLNSTLGWAVGLDGYILRYGVPTSVNGVDAAKDFSIYPNPTTDKFRITGLDLTSRNTVKVFDVVGRDVLTVQLRSGERDIDVRNFDAGMYFVQVHTDDANRKPITRKLTINR